MVRIIDAHCHIYPDGIAPRAVRAVDDFYDKLTSCRHDGTVQTLISSGNACGITHFLVHSVATTPHQVSSINAFVAKTVKESGGGLPGWEPCIRTVTTMTRTWMRSRLLD